jgi:hypothetical protein
MTYPTIISFYTNTWTYLQHAERLKRECNKLGLRHHIKQLETTGEWITNTRLKPEFVLNTMNELDTPLLWIDVDGSIYKKPNALVDATEDFMGRHQRTGPRRTWHVGTMFFNNTESSKTLISNWVDQCKLGTGSDEAAFEEAWKMCGETMKYKELPAEYFLIIDGGIMPNTQTVIAHRLSQCSSKLEMKRRSLAKQTKT